MAGELDPVDEPLPADGALASDGEESQGYQVASGRPAVLLYCSLVIIFGICLMATKSARTRWPAIPKMQFISYIMFREPPRAE